MDITNYQMQNVLKVYANQLNKFRTPVANSQAVRKTKSDTIDLSTAGKRQNLIERIASDIVARIRNGGNKDDREPIISETLKEKSKGPSGARDSRNTQFVYNVIRGEAEKKTNALSVEDADFLARRFEELVRRMMDRSAHASSV